MEACGYDRSLAPNSPGLAARPSKLTDKQDLTQHGLLMEVHVPFLYVSPVGKIPSDAEVLGVGVVDDDRRYAGLGSHHVAVGELDPYVFRLERCKELALHL